MSGNKPAVDENEISPEAAAAIGKARRSAGFAMGIMLLGFMAIGAAIVYRVMRDAPPPTVVEAVAIPQGAEVISALTTDGMVQVTYRAGGLVVLNVFNSEDGTLLRSVEITRE